ncbi:chemotaxis protein CheW [Collimonas silvisoli]|uniref:chemotaxis protein CheW n=1 Tax=Collimonas silvisoli TaxID=2825884 RepID=UPI001B8ABE43|nr:chemotaxis protein CheW [Collimonas silvisoli]
MKQRTDIPSPPSSSSALDAGQILRARAKALSRPRQSAAAAGASLELLEFRLAQECYALETRCVQEVYPLKDLTPLPCTPPFVLGVVNIRGRITPVIDIKKFFDLPDQGLTDLHRIILVRGNDLELGLLADVIVGMLTVAVGSLQPALPTLTGIRREYLKGVTADRLVVLDLDRILKDPKIIVHEEVEI